MRRNRRICYKKRFLLEKSSSFIRKSCFLIIIFFFNNIVHQNYLTKLLKDKKIIFTFFEPRNKIPGYLQLCMKTWKIFLPEYEIKLLDYKKSKVYLGKELFTSIICKNMTLQVQADAIRVAILQKYGGLWMDIDNVMLNGTFIKNIKNSELVMIGNDNAKRQYIGFIYASHNSSLLYIWLRNIKIRVNYFKQAIHNNVKYINGNKNSANNLRSCNYLGNGIIDKLVVNATKSNFYRLDQYLLNVFPERTFFKNSSLSYLQKYRLFYFKNRDIKLIFNKTKNILLLHNSWTPLKYKTITKNKFLKKNILLSNLLKSILKKKKFYI